MNTMIIRPFNNRGNMELTPTSIEGELKLVNQHIQAHEEDMERISLQTCQLFVDLENLRRELNGAKRLRVVLERARVVLDVLENSKYEQIRAKRGYLIELIGELKKDIISVRRNSELKKEIEEVKLKIQADCPGHPFVASLLAEARKEEYDRDQPYQPDPGYRQCILCGSLDKSLYGYEEGSNNRGQGFTKLLESDCFIVEDFWTEDIWRPLHKVLNESIRELSLI